MTIRLTIAEGDHFDFTVKSFDQLTTAEHIRIFEEKDEATAYANELEKAKVTLQRYSGAPNRFVRYLKAEEVDAITEKIAEVNAEHSKVAQSITKVYETMEAWGKEHDEKEWTLADATAVLQSHGLFREKIEVNGRTYTAPLVEHATFGQWIDLQGAMDTDNETTEGMSYVRALAILMEGQDGTYPVQSNTETDSAYQGRVAEYTQQRQADFLAAKFVDVLGVAAFFFSNSDRFAEICAHNMSNLMRLLPRLIEPVRRVIPSGGAHMPS